MEEVTNPWRRPVRIWMTGSIAVVMSAMVAWRAAPESERQRRQLRASPYGVAETVLRIEQAARRRGLEVLWVTEGDAPVIVLASSTGGTPVLMRSDADAPDVPLALQVQARDDGGTEVALAVDVGERPADWARELRDVSGVVADEVAALPRLVERALA